MACRQNVLFLRCCGHKNNAAAVAMTAAACDFAYLSLILPYFALKCAEHIKRTNIHLVDKCSFFYGGEGGIWTLATCYRPTPLAGEPLHHLGTSPNLFNFISAFNSLTYSFSKIKENYCFFEKISPNHLPRMVFLLKMTVFCAIILSYLIFRWCSTVGSAADS